MDVRVLLATIGLLVALVGLCLLPVSLAGADDQGDGRSVVAIPRPRRTPPMRPRTWVYLALTAAMGLAFVLWPLPSAMYVSAVRDVASAITHDPATVNGYVVRLRPAVLQFAVSYVIGIALVIRAGLGRRLMVAVHAPLYIAMTVLCQALMIVGGMGTGWAVAPFGIEATLANLLIGGLVAMRLMFTTFVLPRATTVPVRRPRWAWDSILAVCALVSAVALLVAGFAALSERPNLTSTWQVFVPLYTMSLLFVLMFAPLYLLWWTNRRLPLPDAHRPPVDVLIPAYNEEDNIARVLHSVDAAAGRYGGHVRVVVSNDGSTDATERVAAEEIATFRHARGEILTGPNGRQAAALNRAIALTDAEIVVRIDADCEMGPDALRYAVPWFRDPKIGSVGAMEEPRTDNPSWFHRMRALECMFQFRFARLAQSMVDGIVVIPGTFTAFRRAAAAACGGFPTGMNGEDADLTMQIGRLGYRVVVDPRIRSYEDVPRSPGEFLEQRTRWARAGMHVFARHAPIRTRSAGPRVWFWTLRRGFAWFSMQAGLAAPALMVELTLAHPTYRRNIATLALLYLAAGALPLVIGLPLAVKYRHWRSILWLPTWYPYAFMRRMATLEAAITLPTRPLLSPVLLTRRRTSTVPGSEPAAPVVQGLPAGTDGHASAVRRGEEEIVNCGFWF